MKGLWDAAQPKFDIYGAIKGFEGYTPRASWDYKQHSIGYGTRARYPGEVIDRNEAENRLRSEVDNARRIVDGFAPNAPEGVKAALTSLTFNAGSKWTESGLGQAVKAGDWGTAQNRFLQYNKAGGSVLPGLVKRRQQEASWFNGAAPSIGAAPVASNPQSAPSQRMSLGGPMPAKQQQTESPSWWGDMGARLQNPLFLGGLGMLVAANQGQDAASALNQGMRTGALMQDQQMQNAEMQRERAKQQALEEFWNSYDYSASGLPKELIPALGGLSPAQRAELVISAAGSQAKENSPRNKLEMEKLQAETENLRRKQEPDPIESFIRSKLPGAQAAPAPRAPMLQPQSFNGGPQLAPGIQLIADDSPALQTPPQAAQNADMVDIPMFGKMPRKDAQELGMMLQMSPKYSTLGKSIMEMSGGGGGAGISKPAENQIDERTISAASTLGRIQDIRKQFKPEFLQIPNKMKLYGASWGSAFGGKLSPELEGQLRDFAAFKATAFDNFNQLLKELSGTAVSAQELARQKIVQPNPGEGLFDGDDPVTFMSKMNQIEKVQKSAIARMNYIRSKGLMFDKEKAEQFMRLEDVPKAIDERGAEIERELKGANPKADPMAIQEETKRRLKQEFGI